MRIHFVCSGNAYRSRLAEAYIKSKKILGLTVSSSGVERNVYTNGNGPVTWYAMRLLKNYHLIPSMKWNSTQTTEKMLSSSDIVTFFGNDVYQIAKERFHYKNKHHYIWDILDVHNFIDNETSLEKDFERLKKTAETFEEIKENVDKLVKKEKLS